MIYLANSSQQKYGGGFSFIDNFRKAMGTQVTDNYDQANVYLIPGPTMVQREEVAQAKRDGKKVILRVDNAVRNSRNRNTGMSRMKDFAKAADAVVFQSRWTRDYLTPFLDVSGEVIHNAVDESVFHSRGRNAKPMTFLYSRYNRDETKNWEMARYQFSQTWLHDKSAELTIIGNFSPELVEGSFDFYMGERVIFLGVQPPEQIATVLRSVEYLIAPYYNDACSNTIIEALLCGCEVLGEPMLSTGGTPEILAAYESFGPEYFYLERMAAQYRDVIGKLE